MDGLESDLDGQANVLRLDLFSDVGRQAAAMYNVKVIPCILVFDGTGQIMLQQNGVINTEAIRTKIGELIQE